MDEVARKILHIVFGIGIAAVIAIFGKEVSLIILSVVLLSGVILSDAISRGYDIPLISDIIAYVERPAVIPGKGAIFFFLSSLICLIIFPVSTAIPAILCLAIADGIATIAGIRFGKTRIRNGKSVEGACAGFAASVLVMLFLLPPATAILIATVASGIEISTPVDDNLVIPIAVALMLTAVSMIP